MKTKNLLVRARGLAAAVRIGYWFGQAFYSGLMRRESLKAIKPGQKMSSTASIPATLPEDCQQAIIAGFEFGAGIRPSAVIITDLGRRADLRLEFVGPVTA